MNKKREPIIYLLEKNELRVSNLYQIYSRKISGHKDFWAKLSEEELGHADYIHNCYGNSKPEFAENNFTRDAVKYVVDFVKDEIKNTQNKKISHFDAISVALRIEQSILEKKYFDFFNPKNHELKEMMKKINRETERHVQMLKKEFRKLGSQIPA
jgi:rubrerythrin